MASDDMTVRILIEIRDQIAGTNQRVDGLSERVDGLNQRLDGTNQRLDASIERLDGTNQRLDASIERLDRIEGRLDHQGKHLAAIGTELIAVHGALKDVVHVMKGRRRLESRVDHCEREIDELKRRLP